MYHVVGEGSNQAGLLFSGDILFNGGCGRFFEGTAADMVKALGSLRSLPKDTLVYCGHEYTISNMEFAAAIEPSNELVVKCLQDYREMIKSGKYTVPFQLGHQFMINPFLRVETKEMQEVTGCDTPVDVMHALREMKNSF